MNQVITPTGSDDTQLVQGALDTASLPTDGFVQGVVRFDGEFNISSTLITGRNGRAPCIEANAVFKWRGPETSDYMLRYTGEGLTAAPRITGSLWLDCRSKCRGLYAYHQAYGAEFAHILVRDAREIALDFAACWGSYIHSCIVKGVHGIGLRLTHHNTSRVHGIQITGVGDVWPDPNDATVAGWKGELVQTPIADRAALVIGKTEQLDGLAWNLESLKYDTYPLLAGNAINCRIHDVRVEGCQYADLQRVSGSNNEFDNWIVGE